MVNSEMLLHVDDVHTYYGESYVLQGVNLTIPRGKVAGLLGRNGMGKSTLIRSIAGLTPARRGEIYFQGQSIVNLSPHQIARLGVGLTPQGRRIFRSLTVRENLLLPSSGLAGNKRPAQQDDDAWDLEKVLNLFPQLQERLSNRGDNLSGGEQQMLAIGRALMANPTLLLMDEPSEGLAPVIVEQIEQVMLRLKAMDFSILLVEQRFDLAMAVADVIYIMGTGKIVFEGTPAELDEREDIRARYLGV